MPAAPKTRYIRPQCAEGAGRSKADTRCAEGSSYGLQVLNALVCYPIFSNMQSRSREATVTQRRRGVAASVNINTCIQKDKIWQS